MANQATLRSLVLAPLAALAVGASPSSFHPDANMERAKVPDRYKWNLTPLFASDAELEKALLAVQRERATLASFAGKLAEPAKLKECLDHYFALRLKTNKLTLYSSMRYDTNEDATTLQALRDRSLAALNELMTESAFIRQEVLALDEGTLTAAYAKVKGLAAYRPYLEQLRRRRARVLSPEAERVLALAGDNLWAEIDLNEIPSDYEKAFGALLTDIPLPSIQDESGATVPLTLSSYPKYRASGSRQVRREAVEKLFGTLKQYEHALAATFAGQVNLTISFAKSRGYKTAIDAYLDKDEIDPAVYKNLISAVRANVAPLRDYMELRRELLGISDLHIYDLYTPLVPSMQMNTSYEEAMRILPEALAPLGPRYVSILKKGLDPKNGWVDVFPHKHKESGAYSSSVYDVHPFVKMNYYGELDDLSTLAHEYGHALHSHLSASTQPYVTFNYTTLIAEIASTMNEKLLSDYLVRNAKSDEQRLFILGELVESLRTTIYRQTLFAEFELRAHTAAESGTPLTAEWLTNTYRQLLADYYGPGLVLGENDGVEWAYIPHFYYKYYTYAYATGLSAGVALAERVQSGDPAKRDAYLAMLEGGSSKPPLELLRGAGVDLTRPDAIVSAAQLMAKTVAQMRTLASMRASR